MQINLSRRCRCVWMLLACFWTLAGVQPAFAQTDDTKIGIIGLDTSHAIAFTRLINDPEAQAPLDGCRVVFAYPHGSSDI